MYEQRDVVKEWLATVCERCGGRAVFAGYWWNTDAAHQCSSCGDVAYYSKDSKKVNKKYV